MSHKKIIKITNFKNFIYKPIMNTTAKKLLDFHLLKIINYSMIKNISLIKLLVKEHLLK
jgi:hypothetical protein